MDENQTEMQMHGERQSRINALRQLLSMSDYKVRKYIDGDLSPEEYEPIKEQAKAWRAEINQLEAEIAELAR